MGSARTCPTSRTGVARCASSTSRFEVRVLSAHRTPDAVALARGAARAACACSSRGAGGAAHLAGVVAARRRCPSSACRSPTEPVGGLDSLLSTVQMPAGRPGRDRRRGPGRRNAALLAAQILALADPELRARLELDRTRAEKPGRAATLRRRKTSADVAGYAGAATRAEEGGPSARPRGCSEFDGDAADQTAPRRGDIRDGLRCDRRRSTGGRPARRPHVDQTLLPDAARELEVRDGERCGTRSGASRCAARRRSASRRPSASCSACSGCAAATAPSSRASVRARRRSDLRARARPPPSTSSGPRPHGARAASRTDVAVADARSRRCSPRPRDRTPRTTRSAARSGGTARPLADGRGRCSPTATPAAWPPPTTAPRWPSFYAAAASRASASTSSPTRRGRCCRARG